MDITTRRAGLSADKRALLQQRLAGKDTGVAARPTITRCAGEGPVYPASFMQEQMWLVTQLEPEKAVYNVPVSVLVRADADIPAMERAFSEVVRRHEGLRTVFRVIDGQVMQVVMPPFQVRADVKDVRDRVGDDFERDVKRLVTEEGGRFLDVEKGPLVRLSFLRVTEERYALVITVHHIVTDGWAYPLLLHDLWTLYAAYRKGETAELPPVTLRYADYAVWQRAHLTGETLDRHVGFWRDLLAGAPETELVGDRPRPPRPSYRGAFHHFVIDERTTQALRALCRREALTLNMALSAGFSALLARYTGNRDVVVGALFGNRSRPELQEVVGCFVNSAALRLDLTDDPGLAEASRRARKLILEADEHQELPFEKVVEHLHVERDPSRNPLFQVMYFHHTFIPAHTGAVDDGLEMAPVYEDNRAALVDTGLSKLDLTMATLEDGTRLTGVVEYATDLYDAATVERFCRHYVTLLGRAAAEPERPLSQISVLDAEERRTLLDEWSRGPVRPTEPARFHRLFEAQAVRTPNAEAVRHGGRGVTFAELDARANRLARRLRALGVGPETIVALCLERTPRVIESMLAVSKAGGAFLPVDPAYPEERRSFMLEDSGARVAIVDRADAGALPAGVAVIDLDAEAEALAREDASPVESAADVDNAAYVIYTSGSTGRPKGVVLTHRGIASLAELEREALGAREGVRVLQFASFSFDASLWDVFTILSGATLVLAPREEAAAGDPLAEFLERERVNVATLAPSVLAALPHDGLPELRTVVSTGEAVGPEVVRRWSAGRRFVNGYGPTETTVGATLSVNPAAEGRISIGRPWPNLRVYVLDDALRPLPAGAPGEVYVGGVGVARGYLRRPSLTAEKFLPDPFGGEPGARLYRTGDVARWRRDGELEFIGRADRQVKIRGFRIELGEVESALLSRPGVREAAAMAHEHVPGSRRLVAYVAADEGVTADALRASLREDMPEYMVPAAIIILPSLPHTPNGKLDRRALPSPDFAAAAAKGGDFAEPRTHAERVLASAWAQVLGREKVGIHDNFFELGGDSILSIQVIVRAAREGVRIALRQVFQHQTVAELAAAAETAPVVVAEQGAVTGDEPLTPAQRWLLERELPHPAHWNMAIALEARAPLDPAALERAATAVLAHHDALRTRFERGAGGWTATVAEPGPAAVDHVDLSAVADAALDAALEAKAAEAHASLDLAGPLFRVTRFDLGASRGQRVLVVAHHLVVDAVSLPVLA
ncbi:MAG TPA: amino acid adenylation domain-containing protein, partial [Longimicrobium sp.]|nr:amino acid adenylation domain-containing protein [Longimicrobium sp.]